MDARRSLRGALPPVVALFALACSSELPKADPSTLSVCVLQGASVADGCATDEKGNPVLVLGTVGFGRTVSKVVALRGAFEGDTLQVTAAALAGGAPDNLQVSAYTMNGAAEVPVTLPVTLPPRGSAGDELRIRVSFEADPAGALPALRLELTAGSYQTSIPVSGEALARVTGAFEPVACSAAYSCATARVDLCAVLPDLRVGDGFTVQYSNIGSSWSLSHVATAPFVKGTAFTFYDRNGSNKRNTTAVEYDGECGLIASSAYSGDSTQSYTCVAEIRSLAYVIP